AGLLAGAVELDQRRVADHLDDVLGEMHGIPLRYGAGRTVCSPPPGRNSGGPASGFGSAKALHSQSAAALRGCLRTGSIAAPAFAFGYGGQARSFTRA